MNDSNLLRIISNNKFAFSKYVSMDSLWFKTHSVMDLAEYLYSIGVYYLFLDEIHKYPDWTSVLKNLYDNFPKLFRRPVGSS